MARRKSGYQAYIEKRRRDPEFAREMDEARREIDLVDAIIRQLDDARVDVGMSKAELARMIGARPDMLRRLLTAEHKNPTLRTIAKLCDALGLKLTIEPKSGEARAASA